MKTVLAAAFAGAALFLAPVLADVPPQPAGVEAQMDQMFGSHEGYREFFDALQAAAADGNETVLAGMIGYPFETEIEGKKTTLASEAEAIAVYDRLFTAPVLKDIADQKYDELFVNYQGVMIGGGSVWFGGSCANDDCTKTNPIKIIAINQPG